MRTISPITFSYKTRTVLSFLLILFFTVKAYCQQTYCADSSYRIKYIFGSQGALLYNNPDTSGTNMFIGGFAEGLTRGIGLLKTNWGDSMLWAKKIYVDGGSLYSVDAPNGTIVCTGTYGQTANAELMISKIDTNGMVYWIKRFKLTTGHISYSPGNVQLNTILVANNAIYLNGMFRAAGGNYIVAAKLDLNGNILWSKGFSVNLPNGAEILNKPVFFNNSLIVASSIYQQQPDFTSDIYTVFTKLDDADGSILENSAYKIMPNPLRYGTIPILLSANADSTFTLTGNLTISYSTGGSGTSDIIFNSQFDKNLNPLNSAYYKNNVVLDGAAYQFDFNNQKTHVLLASYLFNQNDKFFINFGKNNEVLRSRKFSIASIFSSINRNSVSLDDKQNIHFLYHYPQGSQQVTEYARISNFAASGTLGCFGKDTSILISYPFTLTKEPFVWDNVQTDLISGFNVPYTEDTAIVTKQLVCKIVSRCDSLKITGPAAVCAGEPVRYSLTRNSGCFKNADWLIDTAIAQIINTEGDSAITISFKNAFTGYIYAALSDCVVKDSLPVKAVTPKSNALINRTDSLLCPGKTLVLNANNGFSNYLWQSSTIGQQLTVSSPGLYRITASDSCNHLVTDSIIVTFSDTSFIVIPTQTICLNDTAFIPLPAGVFNINWQPAVNSILRNNTIVAYPLQTTLYNITAERVPNCPLSKNSQVVIKTCPQTVYIPNAFTPNNDGTNDIFKPAISQAVLLYHFIIYNRYGQIVFETTDQQQGWDGFFKGTRQPAGGYMYYCHYRFNGKMEENKKGYFILIK